MIMRFLVADTNSLKNSVHYPELNLPEQNVAARKNFILKKGLYFISRLLSYEVKQVKCLHRNINFRA